MSASPEATEALLQLIAAMDRNTAALDRNTDSRATTQRTASPSAAGTLPTNLPNYGRVKGQPIAGATDGDLEYYLANCIKSINDPAKARWVANETAMRTAIEAEIGKRSGGGQAPAAATGAPLTTADGLPVDDDIPF